MTTFYSWVWGWLGILLHWVSDYKTVSFLLCFFKKKLKIARVIKSCKVAQRLLSFSGSSFITTEWGWAPARELTSLMNTCSYQCVRVITRGDLCSYYHYTFRRHNGVTNTSDSCPICSVSGSQQPPFHLYECIISKTIHEWNHSVYDSSYVWIIVCNLF